MGAIGCGFRSRLRSHPRLHLRVWCSKLLRKDWRSVHDRLRCLPSQCSNASHANVCDDTKLYRLLRSDVRDITFLHVADYNCGSELWLARRGETWTAHWHNHLRPILLSRLNSAPRHFHQHSSDLHLQVCEDATPLPPVLPIKTVNLQLMRVAVEASYSKNSA